ncbi:MAG: dihydroorotase [Desulfobulbaceae bacterium]|nr:dihydroorotase [Candidatus Kapabacteria bacterium]MBS3999721.1 dihydroorotase [Desulfobulbaceae bacterium]
MNLLFNDIRVISPSQNIDTRLNILVKDGFIAEMTTSAISVDSQTKIVNSKDLVASPGLFDMHVHFRQPGQEHKETIVTGTDSAANGGFTGVVCMPNTEPAIDDVTVVEYIKSKSKGLLTDVYISAAITKERKGDHITPMIELSDAGVVLFTDDGSAVSRADVMKLAFEYAAPFDYLLSQHCEEHTITKNFAMNDGALAYKLGLKGYPSIAEEMIVARDLMIASYTGNRRYHPQHISTAGTVQLIRKAKADGQRVTSEAAPHHFVLTDDYLSTYDSNYKMNPPLRTKADVDAIIEGLKDGTIDCIATDHAPHSLHEKHVELENSPNGIVGLETSLGLSLTYLYHTGHLNLSHIIEKMSVNPRRILNLEPILLSVGSRANLTIFNPDIEWTVNKQLFKSKSQNTPFDNLALKGKPIFTINNNQCIECNL